MAASYAAGASLVLGVVLLIAAVLKLRAPTAFELTLVRLLPERLWQYSSLNSRRLAYSMITVEVATGTALLLAPGPMPLVLFCWVALLFVMLALVALAAARAGTPCGCLGQQDEHHAMALARSILLAVLAASLLVITVTGHAPNPSGHLDASAAVGALLLLAALLSPSAIAATRTWSAGRSADTPDSATGLSRTQEEVSSRRTFLKSAATAVAATLAFSAFPVIAQAGEGRVNCQALYFECRQCCGPVSSGCCGFSFAKCQECCLRCYERCYLGMTPCPALDCFSCWPGQ